MPFSEAVKIKAMVACGRSCCICHKFCGNNMEVHHIKAHADGGNDTFENAIPLCFDCHAEVRQYDPKHPKGIKFSEKELVLHRDSWYEKIKQKDENNEKVKESKKIEPIKILHEKDYQKIRLCKVGSGKELMCYLSGTYGIQYDEEAETLQEVKLIGDFLQYIRELIDTEDLLDEPCDRVMTMFNLTESIKEIENAGFYVFAGVENSQLIGGIGEPQNFPVLLIRIVKTDSEEIIKGKV